jgi:23S rRNA-/tRNA-specific pseudouridylate synthase
MSSNLTQAFVVVMLGQHLRPVPILLSRRAMRNNFERSFYATTSAFGLLFSSHSALAFFPPVQQFSTSTSSLQSVLQPEALKHAIHEAWQTSETDGILKLAPQIEVERYDVQDLVFATLDALPTKGQAAGVLNAWIGSCCQLQDPELGAERAWQMLGLYDSLEDLDPDLVTLSLVYTAMTHADLTGNYHALGRATLERAQRLAKKQGGSKRRKSLAASARKQVNERLELLDLHGIQLLHESDRDLVVTKPSGMVCVHKFTTTSGKVTASRRKHQRENNGSGDWDISLEAALLDAGIPLSTINTDGRGLVHRIDRGTSGCIVLAKTDERHAQLVSDFFLRNVKKDYQALVTLPGEDILNSGTLDTPVQGRPALSFYIVEERFDTNKARLRIQTMTGRKHQVRVHCAEGLKAPIVGDTKYASDKPGQIESHHEKERFCLHASCLQVPGLPKIEATVPTWWEQEM